VRFKRPSASRIRARCISPPSVIGVQAATLALALNEGVRALLEVENHDAPRLALGSLIMLTTRLDLHLHDRARG